MNSIEMQLQAIKMRITNYEKKYNRPANSVNLLAVSKKQPIEKMLAAYEAGQKSFGESYLQEALIKMSALSQQNIEWHFIGPLQSNKTRKIAEHFSWVHSVDSSKKAIRLNEQRPAHLPPLNICIEVNINNEITKSGVDLKEVLTLARTCLQLPQLKLRGLMAIPAEFKDITTQRREFHKLQELSENLNKEGITLDTLSMGMSNDFEAAIAEGATIVRIGTLLFEERA
jgi:pyridoxal phosphate enzyme (YggS family)